MPCFRLPCSRKTRAEKHLFGGATIRVREPLVRCARAVLREIIGVSVSNSKAVCLLLMKPIAVLSLLVTAGCSAHNQISLLTSLSSRTTALGKKHLASQLEPVS